MIKNTTMILTAALAVAVAFGETPRPVPDANLLERMRSGVDVIGIVHFTVNTFTDREWGYGSESPDDFNPTDFSADQIVKACRDGGIRGLVVVAKHHDGFCLWPTKTTEHNISKSKWMDGKGDYVGAMEKACRKYGVKFGVYCSPWDRNNAAYATAEYVKTYHAQVEELNDGRYGEIFEMWFDGANGGDGYYGGAWEKRSIGVACEYYRMAELQARVRELQPKVCFFCDDFAWPGNERGIVPPESGGTRDDGTFQIYEADFPLRPGWFYHESQDGYSRSGEFLMKIYLRTVGNGATMDIGIAPDRRGRLTDEDVGCLKRFDEIRGAFFSKPVANASSSFNVIVMSEDIEHGERVDEWRVLLDGRELAKGGKIGTKRIRVLNAPISGKELKLEIVKGDARADEIKLELFLADGDLVRKVMASEEPKRPPVPFELKGVLTSCKPGELVYMMRGPSTVSSIVLSPDSGSPDGTPVAFRLAYSVDGVNWSEDGTEYRLGNIAANPVPQEVVLGKSVNVKYLRIRSVRTLKDGAAVRLKGVEFVPCNNTAKRMTAEDADVRVERKYRPARYERGMLNQHVCQPIDEAAWIWHPDVREPQPGCFDIGAFFMSVTGAGNGAHPSFVRFRRVFLSDGSSFDVDVSADERFVLFLDGKCIARGPNRGWTENWQYQTYSVAVPAGEHVMEAVVMRLGGVAPITQMSCRGGFVLKASGDYDAKLTTGKARWQVGALRGTTMGSEFVGHGGMGCRAMSTGVGFEDEEPSEWKDAVVVARPIKPLPSRRFNWGLRRPGWMLYPSEMPDQTYVERRPGAFRTGPRELSSLLHGGKAVIPAGAKFTAYWDLEDYYCYYPDLVISGGRGASVRMSYAEALVDSDGKKGDRRAFEGMKVDERFHMYDTFVGDGRANARFTSPWWRCGKWIVLDVSVGDEPLTLESLSIRETRYPCEMESEFQSPDDPTLGAIQRICLRSLQNCAHETLMDCPFYEQQMYPADTRVQMLALTALSGDDRLIRRCIDIYDLGRRDDGLVPNNWPTRNFQESQVMSLNYLMMYGDFVRWHRNDEWLKARFPGAMNTLLAMKRQENSDGLLEDVLGSPFIDWVGEWGAGMIPVGRGEGPGAIVNLYYLHAMKSVADMADAAGEPEIAAYWRKRAGELGGRIMEKFWVAEKGLIADDIGHKKFSEHAQCFAILGDVLGENEAKSAFGHLTDGTELARVTVYSLHYLFETFAKYGRGDLILARFGLWRDYLKAGLSTCLEMPVGYRYQRSDCHGWGAHPIYHLRASIAGIRPAAIGFERVRISPSPGGLRKVCSTMPHPSGRPVEVVLEFDGEGGVGGVVKSPVDGEFVWNGHAVPIVAGKEINVKIRRADPSGAVAH